MLDAGELHLPDSQLKIPANRARWFSLLYTKHWVLYAKRPFGGPQQVLSYLANYTHRVALSPRRPHSIEHVGDDGGFGVPVGKESARLSFYIKLENYRPSRRCGRVKSSAGPMGTMRVGLMSS
jgi:hypothetical protein